MYRCFELIQQFMHDHVDLQWLSHGSSMACSQNIWQNMARPVMERIYMHHTHNNIRIHANHIREYQSQLWNNFSSLRTLQRSLIQAAALCEHSPRRQFIPKIYMSRRRDRRKDQIMPQFPEFINQLAANQSNDPLFPHRFRKTDIWFYPQRDKIFLVSNQGSCTTRFVSYLILFQYQSESN